MSQITREERIAVNPGDEFKVDGKAMSYSLLMLIHGLEVKVNVVNFSSKGLCCRCSKRVELKEKDICQIVSGDHVLTYSVRWIKTDDLRLEFGILLEPEE